MLSIKFAYLILLVGAVLFFIMYRGNLSLILLVTALLFPVLLLVLLMIHRSSLRLALSVPQQTVNKGDIIPVQIRLSNTAFLPVSHVTLSFSYQNILCKKQESQTITTSIPAKGTRVVTMELSSAHCGLLRFSVDKIRILDYIRLWKTTRTSRLTTEVVILPQVWPVGLDMAPIYNTQIESDRYSDIKSGDDPSEVFGLRDYQPGDAQSRIHWKISSKRDSLVIKEYSLPIINSACVLLDWRARNIALLETILETALSLSEGMRELELNHTVSWYSPTQEKVVTRSVSQPEDCADLVGELLRCTPAESSLPAWALLESTSPISHFIYITSQLDESDLNGITDINALRKTVLYTTEESEYALTDAGERIDILPVSIGKITQSIQELFI